MSVAEMNLIDTHCHLDFPQFKKDFSAVLERAEEVGISKILNPGCNLATSHGAVCLANKFDCIFAAVGVHPHDADEISTTNLQVLAELAKNPKVLAIGEIGLDYFRLKNKTSVQKNAFRQQLELAEKLQKPVIIHAREADNDVLEILDEFPGVQGVCHCFGGDWQLAQKVLAREFFLGFTGIVTFPSAENLREVIRQMPLEKILIETDAPFLAPQKFRGFRCEPAFVREVATKIAELKKLSLDEIAVATAKNAIKLFGF